MPQQFLGKIYQYTVVFEPAEEGGYVVSVPALPGCVTQGETLEEAMAMAKDAIEGYLSVLKDDGEVQRGVLKSIIKQSGMTVGEFLRLR